MGLNLEIGSGTNPQPGYIHLERYLDRNSRAGGAHGCDVVGDAMRLPFRSSVFDGILMFGVFEHFGYYEVQEVVLEIIRCLKGGGTFRFDVPDFDWFAVGCRNQEHRAEGRDERWHLNAIFMSA